MSWCGLLRSGLIAGYLRTAIQLKRSKVASPARERNRVAHLPRIDVGLLQMLDIERHAERLDAIEHVHHTFVGRQVNEVPGWQLDACGVRRDPIARIFAITARERHRDKR